MTKRRTIRMDNAAKLPDLTKAQKQRLKLIREEFRGFPVSVVRKGQKPGQVCITITYAGAKQRYWYNEKGELEQKVIEQPLFTLNEQSASADTRRNALTEI